VIELRKIIRNWTRRPQFGSAPKVPWYLRLRTSIRAKLVRAYTRVFGFHTPAWVSHLGSTIRPPASDIKPVQYANPIYWIIWLSRFVWIWINSRPYSSLGASVPAILVACGIVTLVVELRFRNAGQKELAYRNIYLEAVSSKSYETAVIALGTLTDLDPYDLSLRYQRALVEEERGAKEAAHEQMQRLAIGKEFGEAALWLVKHDLDLKKMADWKQEEHEKFRSWTDIALKSAASKIPAHMLLASYFYGIRAYKESLRHFSEVTERHPEYALTVATIYKQLGEGRNAQDYARRAATYFEEKLRQAPTSREFRINLAKAFILLEREQDASQLLIEGYNYSQREDQELRVAAGDALIALFTRLSSQSKAPEVLLQSLQVVKAAMDVAPESPTVIDAVIEILLRCKDNKNSEVEVLKQALVKGVTPDSVHFIRGTVALMNNDFETAKTHLELAAKYSENLPGILNNLAVAMTKMEDSDLESALAFSNAALEKMPDQPYLRDTRGQILVKLKRYKEAIGDLEFALKAPELGGVVHEALAVSYGALGQSELAAEHRRVADSINGRAAVKNNETSLPKNEQKIK
jgi:tetratricopeptide (TPR) repeat protein